MSSAVSKLLTLTLMLALALFSSFSYVHASATSPRIYITPPPSNALPLKVYVYPTALDADHGEEFTCQYQKEFASMFYDVLRSFRKVVFRFVDEHPEFHRLLEIWFVNVSDHSEADITFRVIRQEGVIAYTNFTGAWTPYQSQIYVACNLFDRGSTEWVWGVIFHELGHALGLGHAFQDRTGDGKFELMRGAAEDEKTYPSTLDLYAIHEIFFNHSFREVFEIIALPDGLEYKMVIPYDAELRQLRRENEELRHRVKSVEAEMDKLWDHLRNASDVITYLNDENRRLRQENEDLRVLSAALEEQVAGLWGQLQMADIIISRLQEENRWLKANLTRCLSLGLELGEKCNQTIRNLVNEYNSLNANYSVCLDYLAMYQRNANWFKMWTWIMAATALIFVLITYLVMKRHIRKLEEELDQLEGGSS